MSKIVFCFPYKGVGGVSLLFLRVAEYISVHYQYDVYCVDYMDGYISRNIDREKVDLIFYSEDYVVNLPNDSIVVFQTMTPWSIFPNLNIPDESKVFFWNCHPDNLIPTIPFFNDLLKKNFHFQKIALKTFFISYWLKCNRFLRLLTENGSIAFMDSSNKKNTERFYFPLGDDGFLPIPALNSECTRIGDKDLSVVESINMFWVGRIVDFKYHILLYTLKKLDVFSRKFNKEINFTIIGEGDYLGHLKSEMSTFSGINVSYINYLSSSELDNLMRESADLVFAMGTSALESAKLGIPTVLLDVSYFPVKYNYKFRFLYEADGSTLGDVLDFKPFSFDASESNLNDMVIDLVNNYETISEKTRQYFVKNHSIDQVSSGLIKRLDRSSLRYIDLKKSGCLARGFLYKAKKNFFLGN